MVLRESPYLVGSSKEKKKYISGKSSKKGETGGGGKVGKFLSSN